MNEKSDAPSEAQTSLHIITCNQHQLIVWFYQNNGSQQLQIEKPLDTDEHKQLWLDYWVAKYYYLFIDHKRPTGHLLDEKWFYATNRRRQIMKFLPQIEGEPSGSSDVAVQPKMRSRLYPMKVNYVCWSCCQSNFIP